MEENGLKIDFTEIWYQNCQQVWTYHHPDGDVEQTINMLEASNNHTLTFPKVDGIVVDGQVITAPFEGEGGSGVLSWTLNIY